MASFPWIWPFKKHPLEPQLWPEQEPWGKLQRRTKRYFRGLGWKIDHNVSWESKIAVRAEKAHHYVHLTFHDSQEMSLKTCLRDLSEISFLQGNVAEVAWGILSETKPSADLVEEANSHGLFILSRQELPDVERIISSTIQKRRSKRDQANYGPTGVSKEEDDTAHGKEGTNEEAHDLAPRTAAKAAAHPAAEIQQPIVGFLEILHPLKAYGWAADPEAWDDHLFITIAENEVVLGEGHADTFRPDLRDAGVGKGDHGFCINFATRLPESGAPAIQVTAKSLTGKMKILSHLPGALLLDVGE